MRKSLLSLGGAAFIGLAAGMALSPNVLVGATTGSNDTFRSLKLFGDVYERVRSEYVEEVADQALIEAAINGMLASLDPHSSYLDANRYRDMQVQTRGEFGGLGIEVTMENGLIKVVSPIDDTPAAKAGLLTGDLISHIDGEPVTGLTLSEAVEKMRGPVDTKIDLRVVRKGREDPFDVSLARAVIKISPVRARLEGDIAYLRVTTFSEQTTSTLREKIEDLKRQAGGKLRGAILDLRNNPGGLLDQAVSVSDTFLDKGEIVSTRGRRPELDPALQRSAGRFDRRVADGGADQWRLGICFGNRGGGASGSSSRNRDGHPVLRQGVGPDDHADRRPGCYPVDDGKVLHTLGYLDPGQGHLARHRGA